MAESQSVIYTKDTEQTLVLGKRNYLFRPFDVGDWTELRMGMFVRSVSAYGDDKVGVSENVGTTTPGNRYRTLAIGIKNSDNEANPFYEGSYFLGISNNGGYEACATDGSTLSMRAFGECASMGMSGMNPMLPALNASLEDNYFGGSGLAWDIDPSVATYCCFIGLKIRIYDKGLATQYVALSVAFAKNATPPYNQDTLFAGMHGTYQWGPSLAITWNDGSTAFAIPDALFIRFPFENNRCRLSAVAVMREA